MDDAILDTIDVRVVCFDVTPEVLKRQVPLNLLMRRIKTMGLFDAHLALSIRALSYRYPFRAPGSLEITSDNHLFLKGSSKYVSEHKTTFLEEIKK